VSQLRLPIGVVACEWQSHCGKLYDLKSEVPETNDLPRASPAKVKELSVRLDAWL
jgi:hypothetical protein